MSIAFCYITDGKNDPEIRRLSVASLRRHCGKDVPILVMSTPGMYKPLFGETLVDVTSAWKWTFGDKHGPDKLSEGSRFPLLLFAKALVPLIPHFSQFDRVAVMDDDIEVVQPGFREYLEDFDLSDDADIGIGRSTHARMRLCPMYRKNVLPLWPKSDYFNAGVVLNRTTWTSGYVARLRACFDTCMRERFPYPEEMAFNLFLRIAPMSEKVCMVPAYETDLGDTSNIGASPEEMKEALSIHWGGLRKQYEKPKWAKRYKEDLA